MSTSLRILKPPIETPDPPFMTPRKKGLKTGGNLTPKMTSQGFLGMEHKFQTKDSLNLERFPWPNSPSKAGKLKKSSGDLEENKISWLNLTRNLFP